MQRILDGEAAALRDVFDRFGTSMFTTAFHVTRDRTIAEDTVQDVLLALWHRPTAYDPTRASLGRWLRMRCRSAAIDRLRSQARRVRREVAVQVGAPRHHEDTYFASDSQVGLLAAVTKLRAGEQTLIRLTFVDELSYTAAALTLGIPEGTAQSRIRRTLRHLRDDLTTTGSQLLPI